MSLGSQANVHKKRMNPLLLSRIISGLSIKLPVSHSVWSSVPVIFLSCVFLRHAIINKNTSIIESYLGKGLSVTVRHFQLLSRLGYKAEYAKLVKPILDGTIFLRSGGKRKRRRLSKEILLFMALQEESLYLQSSTMFSFPRKRRIQLIFLALLL